VPHQSLGKYLMSILHSVSECVDSDYFVERDEDCFHCEQFIGNDECPWFWYGSKKLVMHQACFLDWLARLRRDAERILRYNLNAPAGSDERNVA
jgi:hypothetical protein